jgi:hypothetical protein
MRDAGDFCDFAACVHLDELVLQISAEVFRGHALDRLQD